MAHTSYKTFLMHKTTGNTFEKLIDIKEFPDLGSAPDVVDTTTLSHKQKVGLPDILDPGALEFTANYDKSDYTKCKALEGKTETYAVWFGGTETAGVLTPDGSWGKFEFEAELTAYVKGAGVSSAVDMGISFALSSEIRDVAEES